MNEYHVLSNEGIIRIIFYSLFIILPFLCLFAEYFGKRDAFAETQKKSLFRKVIPWVVLCLFLSDLVVFVNRLICYPWFEEAMPSQASIFRELQHGNDDFIIYGWANDYQLALLMSFAGMILWTFWTVYAFKFKPSETSWWKKTCKAIAYIIISVSIIGFNAHTFEDFFLWTIILAVIIILLYVAGVRKAPIEKQSLSSDDKQVKSNEPVVEQHFTDSKEYNERFMPKPRNTGIKENSSFNETSITESSLLKEDVTSGETENKEDLSEGQFAEIPKDNERPLLSIQTKNTNDCMMFCKYCGKRIEADSLYCKYCGKKL